VCGKLSVWAFVVKKTKKDLRARGAKVVCSPSAMPSKVILGISISINVFSGLAKFIVLPKMEVKLRKQE